MSCTTINLVEQVFTIDITECGLVIDELDGFSVYDEGTYKGTVRSIDFYGDNVSVTVQGTRAVVTVTGGSGGGGSEVEHYRGDYDASSGNYPSGGGSGAAGAIQAGDMWFVSIADASLEFPFSTILLARTNTPGQTDSNWRII